LNPGLAMIRPRSRRPALAWGDAAATALAITISFPSFARQALPDVLFL
jgi:hypothetical protein